jgi:hypothetical protein
MVRSERERRGSVRVRQNKSSVDDVIKRRRDLLNSLEEVAKDCLNQGDGVLYDDVG